MTGRTLHVALVALLAAALAWQTVRTRDRLEAGRLLAQVEARTQEALARRRAPSTMFAEHLAWLDRARRLDPLEVGIPIARGTQYLLLRRPDDAIAAYEEARTLEPRPEIDLNLGRALWMKGDQARARAERFGWSVAVDGFLAALVPASTLRTTFGEHNSSHNRHASVTKPGVPGSIMDV